MNRTSSFEDNGFQGDYIRHTQFSSTYCNTGFWGPPTATIDWCETNYEVTHYIAEFSGGDWGEAVWRSAKMQTVTTSWWKRTPDKCQYYDIDFEKDCTGLSSGRKYVHFYVERKAKEDWLMRARMKCSLRFLTMDGEEGFGRRAPLYGSWESKCLNRLWIGDILTSDRRIHWESRDT